MEKTEIPQFETLEEEKAYWEKRGPLADDVWSQRKMKKRWWIMLGIVAILAVATITLSLCVYYLWALIPLSLLGLALLGWSLDE